jgi:hypothetical protein
LVTEYAGLPGTLVSFARSSAASLFMALDTASVPMITFSYSNQGA